MWRSDSMAFRIARQGARNEGKSGAMHVAIGVDSRLDSRRLFYFYPQKPLFLMESEGTAIEDSKNYKAL